METEIDKDKDLDNVDNNDVDESTDAGSLEMSDEDFLKSAPPEEEVAVEEEIVEEDDKDKSTDDDPEKGEVDEDGNKDDNTDTGDTADDKDAGKDDLEKSDATDTSDKSDKDKTEEEEDKSDKKDGKSDAIDSSTELAKIMSPFTANGQTMTPKSAEDVVRLMQMGANYHKKMAGLKPSMKYLKLLEKNNLLDQDKINYLIDLDKKDPAAILRLVKESGIDPMEMDVKKDSNYKPTSRNVADTEIDLDSVLADIKDTPSYDETLNVITNVWDDASRSVLTKQPDIISVINGHVGDGTYKKVMEQVTYERSLGNLKGVSDLDAYKQMGDAMHDAGKLSVEPETAVQDKVPAKVAKVKPKKKSDDKVARDKRRKAAGPTSNKGKTAAANFSPLEMSDEEIMKFDENDLPTD